MSIMVGLALVGTLLGGITLSHQATGGSAPAQPKLACGHVYLPPCE